MNNYLLPCALCGCTKVPRRQGNGIGNNWLECVECGMSTRLREDGAGSEKDWNRRPALAASAPTPSAEPAAIWKAITEEAECVVQRGTKYLMLTEEMCVRLGTAIENIPDLESVQNEYYGRGQEIGYREGIAAASRSAAPLANPSDKQDAALPEVDQDWSKVEPSVAFHLIERHAEDWAHAGQMMEAWRAANTATPFANPSDKQEICGNCNGTGRMVRDPDIGTDQECFACDGTGRFETSDKQEAVAWINAESNYCTSDPIAAKHVDGLKPVYAAPLAQSAEQDRIDAERWRMAILYEYVTDFEVLGIDQRIAIDKGASK